jgi:hypothetical protein
MKLTSLALITSFALAGYVEAQTTPQESAPAPAEKSHHHPLSSACREEVTKLCGTGHGNEMMACIKDNLGTNKFSADCQTQLKEHAKQPAKQPAS